MLLSFIGIKAITNIKLFNKEVIKEKETNQIDRKQFAMYIEDGDSYKEYTDSDNFPKGYYLNIDKSKCEDINGKDLDVNNILSSKGNSVTVKSSKTIYCTLYFDYLGTGEKDKPYRIQYIEDLVDLQVAVNNGETYERKYFELERDLDFQKNDSYRNYQTKEYGDINGNSIDEELKVELTTESGWKPIGNTSKRFSGIFDGKEKRIDNLTINYKNAVGTTEQYLGLFGLTNNATIKNLTIGGNINIVPSYSNNGGIIGVATNNTLIDNCHNEVNITSQASGYTNGGLIGALFSSTIKNSSNSGNISGGNNAGGLTGTINGNSLIENSYNIGNISNTKGRYAGGLIGRDGKATDITTILNSYNNGTVISNREIDGDSFTGGMVGFIYGIINIDKSHNSGEIRNDRKVYAQNIDISLGGLIGQINGNNSNVIKITNSYNDGHLIGATRQGGLIGLNINKAITIIDKCYNKGVNESQTAAGTYFTEISGLVGYNNNNSELYVLNSYNEGDISSIKNAQGITYSDNGATANIINSYNVGNINGSTLSSGIFAVTATDGDGNVNNIKLNNVYNLGEVTGNNAYELGYRNGTTSIVEIKNSYYEESKKGTNISDADGTPLSLSDMKSNILVDKLNNNINSITIPEEVKGIFLSKWQIEEKEYPTLINNINDLSENNRKGTFNIPKWDEEGITTGIEEKYGYVNCGLEDYDFKDSLSFVIRVKFNKINTNQQEFIGNWDSAGGGIYLTSNNKIGFSLYSSNLNPPAYKQLIGSKTITNINEWYTIIGNYNGKEISLYVNGIKEKSASLTGNIEISKMPILIGANPNGNPGNFTMTSQSSITVSDALIFDRALNEEEIKENYSAKPNPVNKDNLLIWYDFREK